MSNKIEAGTKQKLLEGAKAPSAPGRAAKDVFVSNMGEKRYLWTARAFAVVTAISLCCNLILILAIMNVVPLFRVEPFLLTFQDKAEQVYNIRPIRGGAVEKRAITEAFVREYVLMRSAFERDIDEMEARWMPGGIVQEMSSPAVYQDFINNTATKALDVIRTRGLLRMVRIISVIESQDNLWQVEYETRDMFPDSAAPEINYWRAVLRTTFRAKRVKHGERLKNPIGFTVTAFSLQHIRNN
jgi:type IV secretory pathway component VirB8